MGLKRGGMEDGSTPAGSRGRYLVGPEGFAFRSQRQQSTAVKKTEKIADIAQ